jgi:hypothetical protein
MLWHCCESSHSRPKSVVRSAQIVAQPKPPQAQVPPAPRHLFSSQTPFSGGSASRSGPHWQSGASASREGAPASQVARGFALAGGQARALAGVAPRDVRSAVHHATFGVAATAARRCERQARGGDDEAFDRTSHALIVRHVLHIVSASCTKPARARHRGRRRGSG